MHSCREWNVGEPKPATVGEIVVDVLPDLELELMGIGFVKSETNVEQLMLCFVGDLV